ncbi:unnamed protein product [Lepeophtheirus salmonis]|uniref:(salmon louse) hypothetical protein n=1 Tax=Lepeophtheirus salmonis TaxID=72036 RepID=A0A7R8D127_LEPSM|nr:unnamed protein product [Lepeophtheirus salmonis]CAF2965851.1 unnamed protein product [Lepeophtheirus salmonis]
MIKILGKNFLVDTGAEISVNPVHTSMNNKPSFFPKASNSSSIPAYTRIHLKIYKNDYVFPWKFIKAKLFQLIVWEDIHRAFDLLSDLLRQRLLDASDFRSIPCNISNILDSTHLGSVSVASKNYTTILSECIDIIKPEFSTMRPKRGIVQNIETTGPSLVGFP